MADDRAQTPEKGRDAGRSAMASNDFGYCRQVVLSRAMHPATFDKALRKVSLKDSSGSCGGSGNCSN